MQDQDQDQDHDHDRSRGSDRPITLAVIGGSGLGASLAALAEADAEPRLHEPSTPFGLPAAPIHEFRIGGLRLLTLQRHGAHHQFPPSSVPYRANIFALKQLGATHLLASGAVGSLREELAPRDLVLVDQFIDRTRLRPLTFYEHAAVHVEFADPVCPVMSRWLQRAAAETPSPSDAGAVHPGGCYVCMEGPAFSTRAEARMHRGIGGDLIGMTAMPEARLAREAELPYALVAMVTDYDCWRPDPRQQAGEASLLEEIIGNLQAATAAAVALIRSAVTRPEALREPSAAHQALTRAIWTPKNAIATEEVERLRPLWGRHFES